MTDPASKVPKPSVHEAPVLQQIAQAYASPDNEGLTEASIIASNNYLQQLPDEVHWLCNSSPLMPLVVQAVQLWGYGEAPAQEALANFKPKFAAALGRCSDCAVDWHLAVRRELRRVFQEVYIYDESSTKEFFTALAKWDVERLTLRLGDAFKAPEYIPMSWKHVEVKGPLMESLAEPDLLLNEAVFTRWKDLFLRLDKLPPGLGETWLPGAFVLLFDSHPHLRELGKQMFRKRTSKISVSEFEKDFEKPLLQLLAREFQKVVCQGELFNNRSMEETSTMPPICGMLYSVFFALQNRH